MRRRALSWSVVLGLAAGQAGALTCLPQTIAGSFADADASEAAYVLALGALERTGPNRPDGPETGDPNRRVSYRFAADFTGHFAGPNGFDQPRQMPVTVTVSCFSAWCGSDGISDRGLYFLRQDGAGAYTLESELCPRFFFDAPTEAQLREVLGLLR